MYININLWGGGGREGGWGRWGRWGRWVVGVEEVRGGGVGWWGWLGWGRWRGWEEGRCRAGEVGKMVEVGGGGMWGGRGGKVEEVGRR